MSEGVWRQNVAVEASGLTYRQLDHAARSGVKSLRRAQGPGVYRAFDREDLLILRLLYLLRLVGMRAPVPLVEGTRGHWGDVTDKTALVIGENGRSQVVEVDAVDWEAMVEGAVVIPLRQVVDHVDGILFLRTSQVVA